MAIIVPDKDYFYMITLVGFIEIQKHFKIYGLPLKRICEIVDYFRPSKIAINFVFI